VLGGVENIPIVPFYEALKHRSEGRVGRSVLGFLAQLNAQRRRSILISIASKLASIRRFLATSIKDVF
jgi:hypothetical protein